MDVDIIGVLSGIITTTSQFLEASFFIAALKFFLFVYVSVLFADIVLLFLLRGFSSDVKSALFGTNRPLMARSSAIKRWENILSRLASDNPSQFKVALLEADAMADEILAGMGFKGATMGEKMEGIHAGQLETRDMLIEAHAIRNRIIHEADFSISREDANEELDQYKKFFDEVELF